MKITLNALSNCLITLAIVSAGLCGDATKPGYWLCLCLVGGSILLSALKKDRF